MGVAGVGFIGRVHARSARLAGARLVGVAASTPQSAAAAATELDAERAYDSAHALATSDEIDVVHICTPNGLHLELAEAALAAGKHVVCEKPLAVDAGGAERLAAAAASSGLVATVPFVYRFHPMVREAQARVTAGRLGDLRLLHGSYLQDWMADPDAANWRVDRTQGGASRAFADIGSHWCDLVEFVSGHRLTRLSAHTITTVAARPSGSSQTFGGRGPAGERVPVDTEDAVTVQFETDRGAAGSVLISQVSPGRKNRLWIELDGSAGAVAFDQEEPEKLWVGGTDGHEVVVRDPDTLGAAAARYATLPAGHAQGYHDCFDAFVADTYAAVRGDASPEGLPTFADGRRAATITDAVLASARDRRWVEVPS